MLIRNIELKNKQLLVGGKVVRFNEEGVGDIPDNELFEALLKIKGFTDADAPVIEGKINLQEVKSISIDELEEKLVEPDPEEKITEPTSEEPQEEKSKSKKKGR